MSAVGKFACVMVMTLTAMNGVSAEPADFVNRRDQARQAFLATAEGVFGHYCAHCHGEDGTGAGRLWSLDLSPEASDLTASTLDEAELLQFIDGGSARFGKSKLCPPWGLTISSTHLERLARYLVSLRTNAPPVVEPAEDTAVATGAAFPWRSLALILAELAVIAVLVRRMRRRPENKGS